MNYEEKYKQALQRAKECLQDGTITTVTRDYIWEIFPELEVSEVGEVNEDERIRKGLINGFKECLEDCQYPKNAVKYWHDVEVDSILAWLEKQGEQPTNKIEPKFKVGDWVVSNNNREVWQIGARYIREGQRIYLYNVNDVMMSITLEELNNDYHLWTIDDAKDGDVLVNSKGNPFIFTGKFTTNYHNPIAYCGIGNENKFIVCALNWRFHWAEKKEVSPATKEQRDLLFQKMKENGYEWNAEKKELNKIGVKTIDADKVIEWLNDQACLGWIEDIEVDKFIQQFKQDFNL